MKNITRNTLIITLALILVCFSVASCSGGSEKCFSGEGFSVTLDSSFVEKSGGGAVGYYESKSAVVTVHTESFASLQGYRVETPTDYAKRVIAANGLDGAEITEKNGLVFFEYQKTVNNKECKYLAALYRGSRGFWLVQFGSLANEYESIRESFLKYAKSFSAD